MSDTWHRRRRPDEVPTPIAVAVSDFCRRAGSPAPAPRVREALALLEEGEDFRVRALTDAEPEARPLGPFALIDILRGTPPAQAAQREEVGYYELVRTLAELRQSPPPLPVEAAVPDALPVTSASQRLLAQAATKVGATRGARATTVQERIAPTRRAGRNDEPAADEDESFTEALSGRRRELPQPRGRFTQVSAAKRPFTELRAPELRDSLEAMVEQHPNRFALHRALAEQYSGSMRGPLTEEDTLETLRGHGVLPQVEEKERQALLTSYAEHRGAQSRVSWALGLSPSELDKLQKALGVTREIEEVRERFRREALAPSNLGYRLDLLGRARYLADLGIKRRFTESLTADLRGLLKEARRGDGALDDVLQKLSRKHGVSHELLGRAIDKLGLTAELQRRLSNTPATS